MIGKQPSINNKMIELARYSRGLNQKQLADLVGLQQGTISKIEKDQQNVKDELLIKISEVLNYPESFFYEEINVLSPYTVYYRKRKSLSANELAYLEANLYIQKHILKKLLKSADIQQKIKYLNTNEHGSPEIIAQYVRRYWNMPRGPINNLMRFVEAAGILVVQIDTRDDKFDGQVVPDEHNIPIIYLNKNLSGDRLRYTLAHELGHLIMHTGTYTPSVNDDTEDEADAFASELLMPKFDIISDFGFNMNLQRFVDLKRHWKVSMRALIRRARDLGFLKENYTSLNVQLSKQGFSKREPIDIPIEKPVLFKQLLDLHFNELDYDITQLAKVLCLNPEELQSIYDFYSHSKFLKVVRS